MDYGCNFMGPFNKKRLYIYIIYYDKKCLLLDINPLKLNTTGVRHIL